MSERARCVDCHERKDACQIDPCMSCTHPLCEHCALDNDGTCRACSEADEGAS